MKIIHGKGENAGDIVQKQTHKDRIRLAIVIARSSITMNTDNLCNLSHGVLLAQLSSGSEGPSSAQRE